VYRLTSQSYYIIHRVTETNQSCRSRRAVLYTSYKPAILVIHIDQRLHTKDVTKAGTSLSLSLQASGSRARRGVGLDRRARDADGVLRQVHALPCGEPDHPEEPDPACSSTHFFPPTLAHVIQQVLGR